jgi:hypothetical protein
MSQGIEILCHNLSHSDLVLSINNHVMSHPNGCIIARPGFSHYREISGRVVQVSVRVRVRDRVRVRVSFWLMLCCFNA